MAVECMSQVLVACNFLLLVILRLEQTNGDVQDSESVNCNVPGIMINGCQNSLNVLTQCALSTLSLYLYRFLDSPSYRTMGVTLSLITEQTTAVRYPGRRFVDSQY